MQLGRLAILFTLALLLIPASEAGAERGLETILGKRPTGTIHARRVTFRFNSTVAGSTFQCKLDEKTFRSCSSPQTYKGLAEGKHTFKVRAIGPTGLVDPTPGVRKFRVAL
jgi:hypothetical protein